MVTALHENQHSELEGQKVLETSSENARFSAPKSRNFRPLGIKYILNLLYLLNFLLVALGFTRQLEVTKVTAADCKPFGGPPTQPWTQDLGPKTLLA